MFKDITAESIFNLKIGDNIVLYGITESASVVTKKYFRISAAPRKNSFDTITIKAIKIRKDGSRIIDRWTYNTREVRFDWNGTCFTAFDGTRVQFYIEPTIPCEQVINKLKEEKRKINKKIMDCLDFMYKK